MIGNRPEHLKSVYPTIARGFKNLVDIRVADLLPDGGSSPIHRGIGDTELHGYTQDYTTPDSRILLEYYRGIEVQGGDMVKVSPERNYSVDMQWLRARAIGLDRCEVTLRFLDPELYIRWEHGSRGGSMDSRSIKTIAELRKDLADPAFLEVLKRLHIPRRIFTPSKRQVGQ